MLYDTSGNPMQMGMPMHTVTTEHAGVLLAVWGKGTAALLPAVKGRWLRVDECRHDILRFIARVVLLNLACVNITGASPLGFTRVASLDVTSDGGAEVVMLWIVPSIIPFRAAPRASSPPLDIT
jgi:hypothetical protein